MDFSANGIIVGVTIVFLCCAALLGYIVHGIRQERKNRGRETYRWEPETDYDVVQTGEGPMTPPWPQLKEKTTKNGAENRPDAK